MQTISNVVDSPLKRIGQPKVQPTGTWQQQQSALRALGTRTKAAQPPSPPSPGLVQPSAGYTGNTGNSGVMPTTYAAPKMPVEQPVRGVLSFPGLVGSLAGAGAAGSPAAQAYTKKAVDIGESSVDAGDQARDIAAQFGQKIAEVGTKGARFQAGQLTTGTSPVAEGNAAVTARTTAAEQAALAAGESAALQGVGYMLQGRQQGSAAALGGAGQEVAGQGQRISALGTAAGLVSPNLSQYGQKYYSPLTGEGNGSEVPPTDPFYQTLSQYAQLAASNQLGAIPGFITGNPVLNAQVLRMAQQINPSFNYNAAAGYGAGQQSNAQTGATAAIGANQSVLNPAYSNYLQLQQTTQNIDQFGRLLMDTMSNGGINPTNVKYANKTLAEIRGQLSSEQQAIYDNTLASLKSRVSGLLAAGGAEIPTQVTADANKILDGSLPLSALAGVLQRIQQEGNVLLTNSAGVVNTAFSGTQGFGAGGQWPGWNP